MQEKLERVNYHTHCERCRHASGKAHEYAAEAIDKKLVRLGFSDHLPFPDDRFGYRMPYSELVEYFEEITSLKEELKGKIDIFCGFEGEYFETDRKYYEMLLAHDKCDYLILGQHSYENRQGQLISTVFMKNTLQYEEYAKYVVEAMKTGYFRYAAHPDIIFLNDFAWDIHCERACDILIDGAVKHDFALEFNANGYRRGIQEFPDGPRYQYPHEKFWDKVKNTGIDVYVGSDCHAPELMYDEYVERAYRVLKEKEIAVRTEW